MARRLVFNFPYSDFGDPSPIQPIAPPGPLTRVRGYTCSTQSSPTTDMPSKSSLVLLPSNNPQENAPDNIAAVLEGASLHGVK